MRRACLTAVLLVLSACAQAPGAGSVPVRIAVDRPCVATAVVEREDGTRVANLISETPLPAGPHTFYWDGYDVGLQKDEKSPYIRHRVEPGTYRVRGLVHDGIRMRYEMSLYSPGNTPWKTEDGTGSWLGDHSVNADCLFLPAGGGSPKGAGAQMLLSAATCEAGTAIAWTDLDGRKLGSHAWGWDGAFALARDEGEQADKSIYAFALRFGVLRALKRDGSSAELFKWQPTKPFPVMDDIWGFVDLAVRDRIAVISNSDNRDNTDGTTGNLLVVDLKSGKVLKNHVTAPTRGIAFGKNGRLYAVIWREVRRFRLDPATGDLTQEDIFLRELEEPRRMRFDAAGNAYVGVWGRSHQVCVFDMRGNPLRTIGKPGGGQIGRYDEERMERPEGMVVDERGRLWVAEGTHAPKRISIWDAGTGKFVRAIYGRPQYGAGGHLDPRDKTVFRYPQLVSGSEQAGMEFKLDWRTGESRLVNIYFRTALIERPLAQQWNKRDDSVPASTPAVYMPQMDVPFRTTWPQTAPPSQASWTL